MGNNSRIVAGVVVAILLMVTVASAATPPYRCNLFTSAGTTIEPGHNILREVGQTYDAYCLFDPEYYNASDVYFKHHGSSPEEQYLFEHTIVNASAIKIHVQPQKAEEYSLRCLNGQTDIMCMRAVKVGYKPEDVGNFTCLSKNKEDLNCSWTIPYNPISVQYMLTYVLPGFGEKSMACPGKPEKQPPPPPNSCYWPSGIFSVYSRDTWTVTFNATNKFQPNGVLYTHNVSIPETVLPNPVENLEAHVDGPNNVTLEWLLPHPLAAVSKSILYEVAYREPHYGDVLEVVPWKIAFQWDEKPDRFKPKKIFKRTVTDLYPYNQYDFRVRLHTGSGSIRPHMWSEAVILTKRTTAMYPAVGPNTTKGAFEVEETPEYRDIYVTWQKVDRFYQGGPQFHYDIHIYSLPDNRLIAKDDAEVNVKENYANLSNMEKNLAYRFEIIPMNAEGPPQDDNVKATVVVPRKADMLKPPISFKVIADDRTANNTVYSVRWRLDTSELQIVKTVTIFWCKRDKYEKRCQNKLSWEIVQDPTLNEKQLTHLKNTAVYLFGISVNSEDSSSGIKWIDCIARQGSTPPPLEKVFTLNKSSKEVVLKWDLDCKAKAADPIGYNISYCIGSKDQQVCPTDAIKTFEHVKDEEATQYAIQNLHPYTDYIFNIAILTQIGQSKWSESVYEKTDSSAPSGPPQQLEVSESGDSWILLSWEIPTTFERNGEIVEYKVNWDTCKHEETVGAGSDISHYNVTNLDAYTNYTFEVIACTRISFGGVSCGNRSAAVHASTKIGVPSEVDYIYEDKEYVKWNHDCLNGPNCFYQIRYTVNSTEHIKETLAGAASIHLKRDLNVSCMEDEDKFKVYVRAFTYNEKGQKLFGPWKEKSILCYFQALDITTIIVIFIVTGVVLIFLVVLGRCGLSKIKEFLRALERKPVLPPGLEDMEPNPRSKTPYRWPPYPHDSVSLDKQKLPCPTRSEVPGDTECQDLIPPGGERGGRNLSGDSGTSDTDPADSSGCSTGGESDSSSASERVNPSSDSGTVQEEPGFHFDGTKWVGSGSLRLRTPAIPYVRQGLADGMTGAGYVSASSVPNLSVGMLDGILPMQSFTPNGTLGTLPEMPLGARTSTGYISMPDADADAISLDVLNNLTLSNDGRQSGFPAYSRYNFPYKKTTPEISPYTKTGSLPWLNTGYVAVAQAEGERQEAIPQFRGYVAVSDAMGVMKRQPSLPSLSTSLTKSVSSPEEELPPGAYCRVGSRCSPGPPSETSPGYVGITQALPLHNTNSSATSTSPINKSPYVTCAIADALVSPTGTPEKVSGGYVSVGDVSSGRWAHPVIGPTVEESREVSSAPVEGSRARPPVPTRPSTSEATVQHNRPGSRWPPLAPSLSKQSSGYVSQETLTFHDPVVMSPKRLLAQSHEPHSVVLSANHKASMV